MKFDKYKESESYMIALNNAKEHNPCFNEQNESEAFASGVETMRLAVCSIIHDDIEDKNLRDALWNAVDEVRSALFKATMFDHEDSLKSPDLDMFSYDEALCPFGREFTVADLPRLKKTDAHTVKRALTKKELIQNKLIQALTEYQSPNCQRANIDIVIEYKYGSGFMSSSYNSPSKDNVAVIFVPRKQGKAFLKKGPGWSHFDQFNLKSSLDSRIKTASARTAENIQVKHEAAKDMQAFKEKHGLEI